MRITIKSFWPGITWFILSSMAFFLPGPALPERDWFSKIELDKIIHVILFATMVVLWCLPLFHKRSLTLPLPKALLWVPLIFFGYSILVEFVQHFFIPGRSFDLADILADAIGCGIGFLLVKQYQRIWSAVK